MSGNGIFKFQLLFFPMNQSSRKAKIMELENLFARKDYATLRVLLEIKLWKHCLEIARPTH